MDLKNILTLDLRKAARSLLTFEAVLSGLTLLMIAVFHAVAAEDRLLLNL